MFACLDVDYSPTRTCAACVLFARWDSAKPTAELCARLDPQEAAGYVPGAFYERELPALLAVLDKLPFGVDALDALVVDGYVWLARERPGMGHYLYEAMQRRVPVIGVAKNAFADNDVALPLLRGESQKPLFVTAVGMDPAEARRLVADMHGPHRVPTLLRWVDQACRQR
ncbi:MAG: endonuclease V [Polyangiales bacterium]|nr:endonuclease V [Myxococcales bacterium]MCB9660215.1 endonuclease V [Sandaracinaceae bacterium]